MTKDLGVKGYISSIFNYVIHSFFEVNSSLLLCLCSSVYVGPVRKPHFWFSHEVAHIAYYQKGECDNRYGKKKKKKKKKKE